MECVSKSSEVVNLGVPFAVSLNDQQFTYDPVKYYYYAWPQIKQLIPNYGPREGGTKVMLKGSNFFPFKEILDEIDNRADVWCGLLPRRERTRATVLNSTHAYCYAPEEYHYSKIYFEISLNDEDYTTDYREFMYYSAPIIYDLEPREGPVKGGTKVILSGSSF
jgi:hypothetical protein